jgi:hypothetical protein
MATLTGTVVGRYFVLLICALPVRACRERQNNSEDCIFSIASNKCFVSCSHCLALLQVRGIFFLTSDYCPLFMREAFHFLAIQLGSRQIMGSDLNLRLISCNSASGYDAHQNPDSSDGNLRTDTEMNKRLARGKRTRDKILIRS